MERPIRINTTQKPVGSFHRVFQWAYFEAHIVFEVYRNQKCTVYLWVLSLEHHLQAPRYRVHEDFLIKKYQLDLILT